MGFESFPFRNADRGDGAFGGDARQYPGRAEVHAYLKAFAQKEHLRDAIQLNTKVLNVEKKEDSTVWEVTTECEGKT